jgi:outer membrane protein assembly factor BamA
MTKQMTVIYRELRTKPGEKYSKELLVRTIREIGQLGFFDLKQSILNLKMSMHHQEL